MKLNFYANGCSKWYVPLENESQVVTGIIFKTVSLTFILCLILAVFQTATAGTVRQKPAPQGYGCCFYAEDLAESRGDLNKRINSAGIVSTPPTIAYPGVATSYATGVAIAPVNPVVTGYLTGNGSYNEAPIVLSTGFSYPEGVTVDHFGMVYVADAGDNTVKKIDPVTGGVTSIGSGFNYPSGVAVDDAGNVFVVDYANGIKKVAIANGAITTLAPTLSKPLAITLDGADNILVADLYGDAVYKFDISGGQLTALGSGFNGPAYLAVDHAGDIYVSDLYNNSVKKIISSSGTVVTLATGLSQCYGIAVDGFGNVYVTDPSSGALNKIAAGSGVVTQMGTGFSSPYGLAIDSVGNLFVTDAGTLTLNKVAANIFSVSPALPAGLTLDPVTGIISGTPTAVTPMTTYTVSAQNLTEVVTAQFSFSTNSALDVHWIHVSGQINKNHHAVLSWQVAEDQVASYEIQASENGRSFIVVGTMASKGNGSNRYDFTDPQIFDSNTVYRIAQVGRDGMRSYSPVISLTGNRRGDIQVFPNPAKTQVTVAISERLVGSEALLYTINSRLVRRIRLQAINNKVSLQGLAAGVYMLRFKDGSSKQIIKK